MVRIGVLLILPMLLFSAHIESLNWSSGDTLLTFLDRNNLPQSIYYELDKEDQKLTEEIISGVPYQLMREENGAIRQVLIPINDELQLHIFRDSKGGYLLEPEPIIYEEKREAFTLKIESSPYNDIIKATGSSKIAQIFVGGFKNSLNFRRDLRKGDQLVMIYDQKYRLGEPFSTPKLQVAMIEMRSKRHFVYLNTDERYYDENGHEVEGFLLAQPVRNARVSSVFTKRRFHPVLKKYRAHLGIDYAARSGTPIMAAGSGKVVFAGYSRGYGKLIKILHSDGYMTLYAHQSSFRRGIKNGKYVKKGDVIGYVGSTGLSTGPHLHFGLYKNGSAINPARVVQVTTSKLKGDRLKAFEQIKQNFNETVNLYIETQKAPQRVAMFDSVCYFNSEHCDEPEMKEENVNEAL